MNIAQSAAGGDLNVFNPSEERLMKIILAPRVTEKSSFIAQYGQYVFSVISDANKIEIKRAVELLFKVKVNHVRITVPKNKIKKGRLAGRRKAYKKAYVALESGHRIDLSIG
jgi:large subunit ribosomal protein L23